MKVRAGQAAERLVDAWDAVCEHRGAQLMVIVAVIVLINVISCMTPDRRKEETERPKKKTEEAAVQPESKAPSLDRLQDRLSAIRTDAMNHSVQRAAPIRNAQQMKSTAEADGTRFGEGAELPRTQARSPAAVQQESQAKHAETRTQFLQQQWKQAENSEATSKDLERAHAPRDPAEIQRTFKREAEIIYGNPTPQYNRRPGQQGWTNSWLPKPR